VDPRAQQTGSGLEVALYANNVFDPQPTLQSRTAMPIDSLTYATTLRRRTIGVAVNGRPFATR
jgi:hypothetical protein